MSRNASFTRKIAYIAAIALLLLPLSALSQPATVSPRGASPGGKLSQLRAEYNLAQAELGEIDPASETMKLASLGLRGVAANILWSWANHYKKVEDWDKLELTVNQIIRLQPNFLEVWDFQAHNLSYNVSVEFDDYRMRYKWVKEGIAFLILGTDYNRDEPRLLEQVGWFTGQKMGRADEQKQFRRLFRDDKDFHEVFRKSGVEVDEGTGQDGKPDNWLVAKLWFDKALDSVAQGRPIRGRPPLLFYSGPPMAQINGAAAMNKDGLFYSALPPWERGLDLWNRFGNRELPASGGFNIRLNDREPLQREVDEAKAEIDRLCPGARESVLEEKLAALPKDQRAAYEKPQAERTDEEHQLAYMATLASAVQPRDILAQAPTEARPRVRQLVEQIETNEKMIRAIDGDRGIVNFVYWRMRCQSETDPELKTAQAHNDLFDADKLAQGEQLEEARRLYEKAFDAWGRIFEKYPELISNAEAQEMIDSVQRYYTLLGQLDLPFPRDFPLVKLLEAHYEGQELLERVKLIEGGSGEPKAGQPAAEDAVTEDAVKEEAVKEEAANNQASGRREPAEKAKSDEPKSAKEKAEQPKADDAKTDDASADELGTEEPKAVERKADDPPPAEVNPE